MPRRIRELSESGIYHIMLRGIEKKDFFVDEEDKQRLIDIIEEKRMKNGFKLWAYCIMDNHVHFLMQEKEEKISQTIKRIATSFAYFYNKKYDRVGHLFQDRFKSEPVRSDIQLLEVIRYIHNNPVKAGMVRNMAEYKWSSYWRYSNRFNYGADSCNGLMSDFTEALGMFSDDLGKAEGVFIDFCKEKVVGNFIDVDNSERNRDKQRNQERINEIMVVLGISKDEVKVDRDKRMTLVSKLKSEGGIPDRQIAEALGLDRNVVQRTRVSQKGTVPI